MTNRETEVSWWRELWLPLLASVVCLVAGVAAWPLTGEWRWAVTAVIAALTAAPLIVALFLIFTEEYDAFAGCIWLVMLVTLLAVPAGLHVWLWTGNGVWGFVALAGPFAAIFVAVTAAIVESDADR
ncbi:hypothetical protein AB0F43_22200 [Kribbella sp. NPDC023972]|uniref:hypothetical protein n=1 Tax=Kribbella sp. NPDC023972 TaxID=3154795 RepID=UPI0033F7AD98